MKAPVKSKMRVKCGLMVSEMLRLPEIAKARRVEKHWMKICKFTYKFFYPKVIRWAMHEKNLIKAFFSKNGLFLNWKTF